MVMSKEEKTKYKDEFNKKNYARIGLYVKPELKDAIEEHRKTTGESMNKIINRAIMELLEKETAETESVSRAEYWQSVRKIIDRNRAEREERKNQKGKQDEG